MEDKYVEKLKKLTLTVLEGEEVEIVLFGSRARRDHHATSDVDIGLIPYGNGKLDKKKVVLLKQKAEDINIPYKIEIVDFSGVAPDFKKEAMKGAVVWRD